MEIYIKPDKKIQVYKTGPVHIKDIAEIYAEKNLKKHIENIKIANIKENKNKCYIVSVIDVINSIDKALPGNTINNVGEMDTIIEFSKQKKKNKLWLYSKLLFVALVLFAGSATAIMSFHSDAQMSTVFENYYYIFFGERIENPAVINLPYALGLAVGIIVFFNHFGNKKLTSDPTPIEVELSVYEDDVNTNIIDTLNKEKNNVNT
ncbi:MAG: stage V sporulation protein AA [Lachnospirales bacterium]